MRFFALIAAFSLYSLSAAQAAVPLPDCWTNNGRSIGNNPRGEEIADGQWIIQVDFHAISKKDLVALMNKARKGSLTYHGDPMVFEPDLMMLHVQAVSEGGRRQSRAELKQRANAQLAEIVSHPAVPSVDCNGIAYPANGR